MSNSRRKFLKHASTLALGAAVFPDMIKAGNKTFAQSKPVNDEKLLQLQSPFTLPSLPYPVEALEPHIDKQTMEIHHTKHHQGYVNNLNDALTKLDTKVFEVNKSLEKIFSNMSTLPDAVRNNAGGHYNHSLFWKLLTPKSSGAPKGKLADAINSTFTSFDNFKKQFEEAATKRFGSGWAWLVNNNGKLQITSTANQDNPLMNLSSVEVKGTPILALDVWEHAYYLKHQNKRAEYIKAFWNVVNWDECERLFG